MAEQAGMSFIRLRAAIMDSCIVATVAATTGEDT